MERNLTPPLSFRIISSISYFRKWNSSLGQRHKGAGQLSFCILANLIMDGQISLLDFDSESTDPHALIFGALKPMILSVSSIFSKFRDFGSWRIPSLSTNLSSQNDRFWVIIKLRTVANYSARDPRTTKNVLQNSRFDWINFTMTSDGLWCLWPSKEFHFRK